MVLSISAPSSIVKRDGRIVPFERERITFALARCFQSIEREPGVPLDELVDRVVNVVYARTGGSAETPTVEQVQDIVELVLLSAGEFEAAKHYILYRAEHQRKRDERPIPEEIRALYDADASYFPTPLQRFQFMDKYSRWDDALGRRETWVETVDRLMGSLVKLSQNRLSAATYERIRTSILSMRVMPSMRLLAMAGPAFDRSHITAYNCAYTAIDCLDAMVEALIISMSGCGFGFSVERKNVEKLPTIKRQHGGPAHTFYVEDSADGWADALRYGLERWFDGDDVMFDTSGLRPAGAVLKTKGGRASGPLPFRRMMDFIRSRMLSRQGMSLRPLDVHDIVCAIGGAAVSGGVRRTAMISLFDADDQEMLHCKDGDFARENPQRWNANNSAVWETLDEIDQQRFVEQFTAMVASGRGEPGIFCREVARNTIPSRRDKDHDFGTNPCAEIVLRSAGFCNLSAAVVRADDTLADLADKVEVATIVGTIQSMATNFPGLRDVWRRNAEEERLLGVDITGQMDNADLLTTETFEHLRRIAIETNKLYADLLGINRSAAVTCVKPSGNTSQLVDCASGLHARWAPYYVRNVRVSASSPLARMLQDSGVPLSPENGQDAENPQTWVVSFPVKSPDGAITRNDRSAVEQFRWWLRNKISWTEHNPSVTITYRPDEVLDLMRAVWDDRDKIGGVAFLPSSDAKYDQLPYIEIDRAEYERRVADMPEIDWVKVFRYEQSDRTNASTTPACEGPVCETEVRA